MNTNSQLAVIIGLAATVVFAGAITVLLTLPTNNVITDSDLKTNAVIPAHPAIWKGHITFLVTDQLGNINDYREIDNNIVDLGHDCVSDLVFETNDASCDNQPKFTSIGITNCDGTTGANNDASATTCLATTDETLTGMDNATSQSGDVCGAATVTYTDATNVVRLSRTFAGTDTGFQSPVRESGIFNACAAGFEMFSIQSFADVNVASSDNLTVNWDITLSG